MSTNALRKLCVATFTAIFAVAALTGCVSAKTVAGPTHSARPSSAPSESVSASASPPPEAPSEAPSASPSSLPASPSAAPSPSSAPSAPGVAPATVFSPGVRWDASASVLSGSAFVTTTSETGGTCVMVANSGGVTVRSAPVSSEPDASTTVCGTVTIPGSRLHAGTWAVKFTYQSAKHAGESNSVNVVIP
jgi:hypothetical protein